MIDTDVLDLLAERCGIESEFVDAAGAVQRTSATTKRALLAALGVSADDGLRAQDALERIEAADCERVLPPVVVATPYDIRVPVLVPREIRTLRWQLTLESGGQRNGTFAFDERRELAVAESGGRSLARPELRLPDGIPHGYHRLRIPDVAGETMLIVTPGQCWLPESVTSGAVLGGVAIALYLLRSDKNWGIGDYTDLRQFVDMVAARGGDIVGLNPLHQMFVDNPEHASPYSPASRLTLNMLNIDVAAIPEFASSERARARVAESGFAARLEACRAAALVDYSGVTALKLDTLRLVFGDFCATASTDRQAAFARFRATGGRAAESTSVFMALREHISTREPAQAAPQSWPPEYHDPESTAVARFALDHAAAVSFYAWLAWIADVQVEAAAHAARPMRVGLYRDLAVGADPAGAETWCNAKAMATTARVGAPPDIHNPAGQNWDLPPFHPRALRDEAYASFIELIRANMRHAGALRIDHVMALQRLYWIPQGAAPGDGAYVRYPLGDLVGILALESHRARCLVVGEDLGTVPEGFRERMAAANILSYRVLFFERESDAGAAFIEPGAYPRLALGVLGNHDLPTLEAWWRGDDVRLRGRLGLIAEASVTAEQLREREQDRAALVAAFDAAGVRDSNRRIDGDALFTAAHKFLAATACVLTIAQIDDVTNETDPVNVPTTSDEHPNWRRRLSRTLEELENDTRFAGLFGVLAKAGRLRS